VFLQDFLQLTTAGVAAGAIYALTAIGFVLLWQTSATINFAQGEFVTLPAFAIVFFSAILGLPFPLAVLAALALSAILLGLGVKRLLIDRLLDRGVLPVVIATLALGLLIRYSLQQFWTPLALPFPALFAREPAQVAGIAVSSEDLGNLGAAVLVILALYGFLQRTRTGAAMQAVAQNRTLAATLGIDVSRMIAATFVLNAVLTGVAALLIAPVYLVKYDIGVGLGIKAFYAAIIGGFNRVEGALVGGLIVGLAETYAGAYVSGQYRDGVALALLVGVLLLRPEGLLGLREEG
jgi:branched-chain amino acid transport system permease protein